MNIETFFSQHHDVLPHLSDIDIISDMDII